MKTYINGFFSTVMLFVLSCSTPVEVQRDESVNFSQYDTYSWILTRRSESQDEQRLMSFADLSVRNTANSALAAHGWKEVQENPDVLVSYDVLVERNTVRNSDPVYSQGYYRNYYNPYTRRWHTIYYPARFLGYDTYNVQVKDAVISLSMVDAKTDKLIWQGWTTEQISGSVLTKEEVTAAVSNIFRKFKPS